MPFLKVIEPWAPERVFQIDISPQHVDQIRAVHPHAQISHDQFPDVPVDTCSPQAFPAP